MNGLRWIAIVLLTIALLAVVAACLPEGWTDRAITH